MQTISICSLCMPPHVTLSACPSCNPLVHAPHVTLSTCPSCNPFYVPSHIWCMPPAVSTCPLIKPLLCAPHNGCMPLQGSCLCRVHASVRLPGVFTHERRTCKFGYRTFKKIHKISVFVQGHYQVCWVEAVESEMVDF